MFIAFEGIDGTGKTTFARYTKQYLESLKKRVFYTAEPTLQVVNVKKVMEQNIGPFTQALIFMADRAEHVKAIQQHIQEGYVVIADRYVDSTFAYQGTLLEKKFKRKEKSYEYLRYIYEPFRLDPDLIFLFIVDPELGTKRVGTRNIREYFEDVQFLRKVQDFYLFLAQTRNYIIIDSNRDLDTVWTEVKQHIDNLIVFRQ